MNSLLSRLGALALLACASCSTQPVDGAWTGQWSVDPTTGPLDVTLVQHGTALTGHVNAGASQCWSDGTVKGTIDGADVLLGVVMSNGAELDFKGTASAAELTGSFTDRSGCTASSGTWTITRK